MNPQVIRTDHTPGLKRLHRKALALEQDHNRTRVKARSKKTLKEIYKGLEPRWRDTITIVVALPVFGLVLLALWQPTFNTPLAHCLFHSGAPSSCQIDR